MSLVATRAQTATMTTPLRADSPSTTVVNVVVDMSESFADPGGSFYVGTTDSELANAARLVRASDIAVYSTDAHPPLCREFSCNGGPFPPHHVVGPRSSSATSTSPRPAKAIQEALSGRRGAIIAPRHVFFQTDSGRPDFVIADLEAAFGVPWLPADPQEHAHHDLLVSAKSMFNGATVHTLRAYENRHFDGVPESDDNAFSLLRERFGLGSGVHFVVTGTVLSICVYQTASNIKQMFPAAHVSIAVDACTALATPEGDQNPVDWVAVVRAMSVQFGVDVITTDQFFGK